MTFLFFATHSALKFEKKVQYTNVLLYDYVWVRYLKQCQIQLIIFNLKILSQVLKIALFCSIFRALCACAAHCSVLYFNEFSMEDSFNPLSKHEKPILTI